MYTGAHYGILFVYTYLYIYYINIYLYSGILFGTHSDILYGIYCGSLAGIYSGILYGKAFSGVLSSKIAAIFLILFLSGSGPVVPIAFAVEVRCCILRSIALAVEVRRCPL